MFVALVANHHCWTIYYAFPLAAGQFLRVTIIRLRSIHKSKQILVHLAHEMRIDLLASI